MRQGKEGRYEAMRRRRPWGLLALGAMVCLGSLTSAVAQGTAGAPTASAGKTHFACNGGPAVPCRFSSPSGNVRCLWTPTPNNVACELLSSRRAYRLRPTGRAKRVRLRLTRRGDTLPTSQQVVFPGSLSCHDTRRSMTCNQDFGTGAFRLSPRGSRSS